MFVSDVGVIEGRICLLMNLSPHTYRLLISETKEWKTLNILYYKNNKWLLKKVHCQLFKRQTLQNTQIKEKYNLNGFVSFIEIELKAKGPNLFTAKFPQMFRDGITLHQFSTVSFITNRCRENFLILILNSSISIIRKLDGQAPCCGRTLIQ